MVEGGASDKTTLTLGSRFHVLLEAEVAVADLVDGLDVWLGL